MGFRNGGSFKVSFKGSLGGSFFEGSLRCRIILGIVRDNRIQVGFLGGFLTLELTADYEG